MLPTATENSGLDTSSRWPTPEGRSTRLSYQPGLDGLRALAVMAVLLYHARYSWMPGGFLGVEIFFVISGYLITSLLLQEWQQSGRINLPAFWLRRARRLLPALFLLLIAILTFAVLFLPDEVASLRSDALAAAVYATNWYFIASHTSYFEAVGRPSLLKHLWSLAIEEQFYVLWPIALVFLLRRRQPRHVALIALAGAGVSASLMALLFQPNVDPSRVYFGTDTRAAGLLIGSALAFVWAPGQMSGWSDKLPLDAIGMAALATLFWMCLRTNQFELALYQGGFAVLSLATAALIAVTVHPRARLLPRAMGWRPMVWIGLRSYGIYLWHWPVYMLTRPQLDVPLDGVPLFAVRLAFTFVLAALSYRYVEMPIRTGALSRGWQTLRQTQGVQRQRLVIQWAAAGTALAFFLMALGSTIVRAEPPAAPDYLAVASVDTISSTATPTSANQDSVPTETPATPLATPVVSLSVTQNQTENGSPIATPSVVPSNGESSEAFVSPTPQVTSEHQSDQSTMPAPAASATPTESATAEPHPLPTPSLPPLAMSSPTASPTPVPTCLATDEPITAIGESVMIGAVDALQQAICAINIDAAQGRLVTSAIEVLRAYATAGKLSRIVIIHIGNNGVFTTSQFDDVMSILGDTRRVIFINIKVPREWEEPNNAVIAAGVKRYRNAVLIDWHSIGSKRPNLFWSDGMHLRPEGARYYAQLIVAAINGS